MPRFARTDPNRIEDIGSGAASLCKSFLHPARRRRRKPLSREQAIQARFLQLVLEASPTPVGQAIGLQKLHRFLKESS